MKYCKPHNRFYAGDGCTPCEDRVIAEAGSFPLRVVEPQAHPRCHQCWNLLPFCHCNGWLDADILPPTLVHGRQ